MASAGVRTTRLLLSIFAASTDLQPPSQLRRSICLGTCLPDRGIEDAIGFYACMSATSEGKHRYAPPREITFLSDGRISVDLKKTWTRSVESER